MPKVSDLKGNDAKCSENKDCWSQSKLGHEREGIWTLDAKNNESLKFEAIFSENYKAMSLTDCL